MCCCCLTIYNFWLHLTVSGATVHRQACLVRRQYVGDWSSDLRAGDELKRRAQQVTLLYLMVSLFFDTFLLLVYI